MGFSRLVYRGRPAKRRFYSAPYDAVILDLTPLCMDGRDILREWRCARQQEPVLILTARDALAERVEGLRLGADDHLCKPSRSLRSPPVWRRWYAAPASPVNCATAVTLNPCTLRRDACRRTAGLKTKRRVRVAELLPRNSVACCRAKLIEEKLYNWDDDVQQCSGTMFIIRKLGSEFIRTVHGIGYTPATHEIDVPPARASG